jgi:hypothetical protein
MASNADTRERVPIVDKTSWSDKHSGRSLVAGVTKDDDGEWTTHTYCKNSSQEAPKWVDAPEPWQEEWQARRQQRNAAKSRVKSLMDKLDLPVMTCPVCGADHTDIHSVSNTNVKEAAFGPKASYEDWSEYSIQWCSGCSVNFISKGDYNYSSVKVIADVFDNDAPSAYLSRHFSMRQDRKKGKLMETADKYQESLTDFHEDLLEVREYVQAHEDVDFEYL